MRPPRPPSPKFGCIATPLPKTPGIDAYDLDTLTIFSSINENNICIVINIVTVIFVIVVNIVYTLLLRPDYMLSVCPYRPSNLVIILSVIGGVIALGIVALIIWKVVVTLHDKREYEAFVEEQSRANWPEVKQNELIQNASKMIYIIINEYIDVLIFEPPVQDGCIVIHVSAHVRTR